MKCMKKQEEKKSVVESDHGIEYTTATNILEGTEDLNNMYWNSFLPIFFERMTFLMRKAMNKSLSQYDLTSSHAFYLIALNLQGPQTLLELSDFLDIDPGNTNRVIRLLTEMGLVDDDRESPRSKKYRVFLTEKGKELSEQVMRDTNAQMNAYFDGISTERVQDLRTTLVDILQNVDPEFRTYVDSKYINPFYTYLGVFSKDLEFTAYPRRVRDDKKSN